MPQNELINLILMTFTQGFTYLLPVIAITAGINYIVGFLIFALFGVERRTFGR